MRFVLIFLFSIISALTVYSQEGEKKLIHDNAFTTGLGYTFVPAGSEEGSHEEEGVFVPTIGIDFHRRIKESKWLWGVMLDYELSRYLVIKKDLERENALLIVPGFGYHVFRHSIFFIGAGVEFERHRNLSVIRLGIEQGFHLSEKIKLSPAFCYDYKEGYDTFAVSVGIILAF